MAKYTVELDVDSEGAVKGIEQVNEALKDTGKLAKTELKGVDKELEGVGSGSKDAKKGVFALDLGFKGLGASMKAAGIGLIVSAFLFLQEALSKNQEIMDVMNITFTTFSILTKQLTDIFVDNIKVLYKAAQNFDQLGSVMGSILDLQMFPFILAWKSMEQGITAAQLAWEMSWLGSGDETKIETLRSSLHEVNGEILDLTNAAIESGKNIVDNVGGAFTEIIDFTNVYAQNGIDLYSKLFDISVTGALNQAEAIVLLQKNAELAAAENRLLMQDYDKLAELERQIRDDVSVSLDDRITANTKLGEILKEQEKLMIKNADAILLSAQAQFKLTGLDEDYVKVLDAKAEKAGVLAAIVGKTSEQLVNTTALDNERNNLELTNDEAKVIRQNAQSAFLAEMDENASRRLQTTLNNLIAENTAETLRLEEKRAIFEEGTQAYVDANNELLDYQQLNANQQIRIGKEITAQNKKEGDAKIQIDKNVANAKLGIAGNTMALIGEIAGKGSKIGKAMAIGQATISGYQGVQNAFSTASESPITATFPAYPFIQAGLAGAFAAVNIAKIVSTKPSGGGGAAGLSTVSTPVQAPAFNIVGQGQGNQIATALGQQQQTPIQAFVVSQDVTTAQSLENGIIQGAILGG